MRHPTIIEMRVQMMACTACGREVNAACTCGAPYVPKKQRAAEAIAANPQKSNRAIADEIGVSEPTVRRARQGASSDASEREGKDGKTYNLKPAQEAFDIEANTRAIIAEEVFPAHTQPETVAEAVEGLADDVRFLIRDVDDADWQAFTQAEAKKALAHIGKAEVALQQLRAKIKRHVASIHDGGAA